MSQELPLASRNEDQLIDVLTFYMKMVQVSADNC
jgi:hypothetical protein